MWLVRLKTESYYEGALRRALHNFYFTTLIRFHSLVAVSQDISGSACNLSNEIIAVRLV